MAALGSTQFDRFAFPLSNPPFCSSNVLWPSEASYSIPSLNASGSQKIRRPAAAPSRSSQIEADRTTAAKAEDHEGALADNDDESNDDFPSLVELSRAALRPKVSTNATKTGPILQRPEQPALQRAGLQVDRTQLGPGRHQGGSRDQPVILDIDDDVDEADTEDEVEGASSDVDTGRLEWDTSLHDTFVNSDLASAPTESFDISSPCYDIEERQYIDELAPGLEPRGQHGISSAQPQTLPQSSAPQQAQTNQHGIGSIARSVSVDSTLHSLPKHSDSGNDGWTEEDAAELEKELGLAWEEQKVESSSAGTSAAPSLYSVEAPQSEIQSREHTETTSNRPEERQNVSRHGTTQGLEEWEQRETEVVVEGGATAVQQEEVGQASCR